MDLKTLLDTPPWDWPRDAGRMFRKILIDQRADESDRLVAAELAGDFTVVDDDLVDTLLTIVRSADEPEQLRAKAAISLGPVLEDSSHVVDLRGNEECGGRHYPCARRRGRSLPGPAQGILPPWRAVALARR